MNRSPVSQVAVADKIVLAVFGETDTAHSTGFGIPRGIGHMPDKTDSLVVAAAKESLSQAVISVAATGVTPASSPVIMAMPATPSEARNLR